MADLEYRIPSNRLSKIKRFGTRGKERSFAVVGKRDGWEQTSRTYRARWGIRKRAVGVSFICNVVLLTYIF